MAEFYTKVTFGALTTDISKLEGKNVPLEVLVNSLVYIHNHLVQNSSKVKQQLESWEMDEKVTWFFKQGNLFVKCVELLQVQLECSHEQAGRSQTQVEALTKKKVYSRNCSQ